MGDSSSSLKSADDARGQSPQRELNQLDYRVLISKTVNFRLKYRIIKSKQKEILRSKKAHSIPAFYAADRGRVESSIAAYSRRISEKSTS